MTFEEVAVAVKRDGFNLFGHLVTCRNHATVIGQDGQSGCFAVYGNADAFVGHRADNDATDGAYTKGLEIDWIVNACAVSPTE